MAEHSFSWESTLPYSPHDVFMWHTRPGAFERLNPPWRPVRVVTPARPLDEGSLITIKIPVLGGLGIKWTLQHRDVHPGEQFCDEQVAGPFRAWKHTHRFIPADTSSCIMRDEITYTLPLGAGPLEPFVRAELTRLFHFRHSLLAADMALHARFAGTPRRRILISGSSGFIGSALVAFLETAGHSVIRLVRRQPQSTNERRWNPQSETIAPEIFQDIDAVIHLGGENLFARRWTPQFKETIRESRVRSARVLCEAIASLHQKPSVVIMASATGYYGNTGDNRADEQSHAGTGFLAETGQAWESASTNALKDTCRLVHLRIGGVLNPRGGALREMLLPFKLGLGGPLGDGSQYLSWISLEDLLGLFEYALMEPSLHGPCNATAPHPITNREFAKALGSALHRPAVIPAPAPILRAALGEIADELLLASNRVVSTTLQERGYVFLHPTVKQALSFELGLLS